LSIPDLQIVEVSLEDLQPLKQISRRTFYASFGELNSPENMQLYDVQHFSDEQLGSELQNPLSRFYFAKLGEEILGYIKLNQANAQTVLPNDGGMEIERIYVDQPQKSRGIGKAFLEMTLMLARNSGAAYIWLGVWEHNTRAIRFYEKNGFRTYSRHIFKLGNDEQMDLLMKQML
jgi:diamine N-acetyltransferase